MATTDSKDDVESKENASTKDHEVCRLTMNPVLKRRSSFTISSIAGMDLTELSLLDALSLTATDILGSIPAQRCIVYIYDKTANLLRPQIVVDCNTGTDKQTGVVLSTLSENTGEVTNSSSIADATGEDMSTSPLVSFPPVVGMVSSCFLQKRCLRMQEPNLHRAFHREYDVPKDMQVDSILCAPVILYHRATAVIQLLNRLHTIGDRNPFEEIRRASASQDVKDEFSTEVTLRRLKTVKAMVQSGFSTKDEQKLLHFATHIAQTIESNMKKFASVRNNGKIREDKAKQALDLLNALNGKVVAGVDSAEMMLPTNAADGSTSMRHATISKLLSETGVLTDMLNALAVIMRLQAIFRGRRQRRADKFAEELEKFKRQRERMKTLIVVQRAVRTPERPKPKEKTVVNRTKEGSSRSKLRDEEPKRPQSPSKPLPTTPSTPRLPPQQPVPQPRPPIESARIQQRRMSATKIQKMFRRQRQRQQTSHPRIPTPAKPNNEKLTKETASTVKVQSFVRGSLARKKLRQARLSTNGPRIIRLRIASQGVSNQSSHDSLRSLKLRSQTCVYAMPERPGKNHLLHRCTRVSRDYEDDILDEPQMQTTAKNNQGFVESRRLVSIRKPDESSRLVNSPSRRSKPYWNRLASPVVWETQQPGLEFDPPGVEFVKRPQLNSPGTADQQFRKVDSPRAMTAVPPSSKDGKASIKLPVLPQMKSSLLCCLLPAQNKDVVPSIAVRPLTEMGHQTSRAKRLQSP